MPSQPRNAPVTGTSVHSTSGSNNFLASLPTADYQKIAPHLKPCLLHAGHTLYQPKEQVEHVYFLKMGVLSLVITSGSGVDVEVGMVGPEGVLGGRLALDNHSTFTRADVQIAGSGWRLPAQVLREACVRGSALHTAILRADQVVVDQTLQSVLCNRFHSIEQRLARWLLMCQDRMQTETLELTHEFIATMLGTRRVGVTLAAGILRDAGLIDYTRGIITILDRPGLEASACECYAVLRQSFDSLTPSSD